MSFPTNILPQYNATICKSMLELLAQAGLLKHSQPFAYN